MIHQLGRRLTAAFVAVLVVAAGAPASVAAVTCAETAGVELKVPCAPLVLGPLTTAPREFTRMFSTSYVSWSVVLDPLGSSRQMLRNENRLGVSSDGHTTIGTSRDLPKGSTTFAAFAVEAISATDFSPTAWNLVFQTQMSGSPTDAISLNPATKRWFLKARNGSDAGIDYPLLPLQYGHLAYFVVGTTIADKPGGMVEAWMAYDAPPDITRPPMAIRTGQQTYQGDVGHNTLGLYAKHTLGSSKRLVLYFDARFGRATTPTRALAIAGWAP